jgi:glycosyltransferase involved in cell wall biosynthesis
MKRDGELIVKEAETIPMVAVITRTKNRAVLLRRAIESVLAQLYTEWIHVIVNDGGDREDVEALVSHYREQYIGRLLLVHNEASRGMEAASNIGIKASDSKYIVIHDDDDSWAPDYLRVMVDRLENCGDTWVKGAVSFVNEVLETLTGFTAHVTDVRPYLPDRSMLVRLGSMLLYNQFPPIAFIFERAYAERLGLYDESFPVLGDWDFNVRFLQGAEILVVPRYLAYYHRRETGMAQNTIFSARDDHIKYTVLLQNRWVREGLLQSAPAAMQHQQSEVGVTHVLEHVRQLQFAQHNTHLVIDNMQKQMDIIYSRTERAFERSSYERISLHLRIARIIRRVIRKMFCK